MQHIQRIITRLIILLRSPLIGTYNFLRAPFKPRQTGTMAQTTIFSLPAELHFQILSYLPFSSHIALASTHQTFNSLLQDPLLRSQRYYCATFPGIHVLLKNYMLRVVVKNNDVKNAKVEILQLQTTGSMATLKHIVVATLPPSTLHQKEPLIGGIGKTRRKFAGEGSILNDYWLYTPRGWDTQQETMDLRKLVVLLKVITPATIPKKDGDKRKYWSTEYPFRIARPGNPPSSTPPNPPSTNDRRTKNILSPAAPPTEPATLQQMITFITKRAIKELGLSKEKEVSVALRVCKLGGTEGYVGFTGEIEVDGVSRSSGWRGWFGR
ncbi:hypothetical protein TWF481_009860 [Arthrobotrys musiformis]|uniref:F-box domain-containing protein n=1 Tax=Arthrobotrys musiformis TaxID=47236 RepID=A0AAV9W6E3_9PEZI